MSDQEEDLPDFQTLSDLFGDLSIQLRRVARARQDGEPNRDRGVEPGEADGGRDADWVEVPAQPEDLHLGAAGEGGASLPTGPDPGRGGGGNRASEAVLHSVPAETVRGPVRETARGTVSYREAVLHAGACFVTPLSSRGESSRGSGVMAAVPGAIAMAAIQARVQACVNDAAFETMYNGEAREAARRAMETFGMQHPDAGVRLAATQRRQTHQEAEIVNLQAGLAAANTAAQNAANAAAAAQAVAAAAGNADRFRPANPPKYGNKDKDPDIRQWLNIVEDYLRTCPDDEYLRLASSYLEGGPRMLWQTRYGAFKAGRAHLPNPEPPIPRQFFRQTLEANYGLADQEQKHWDAWNSLKMTSGMEFTEYVVHYQQALTDLADHVQDEQIKIEKFREGLIPALKEITRTSPAGGRWPDLQALITYAGLQWPQVKERIQRRKSVPTPATKVAGKRRGGGSGSGAKKGRLGAASDSSKASGKDAEEKPRLCYVCKSPDHIASACPKRKEKKKGKKAGRVAAAQSDAMDEDFA